MRYLITGGSGFLGAHFIETALEEKNSFVIALIRKGADLQRIDFKQDRLLFLETDFINVEETFVKVAAFFPEVSIHFGWEGVARSLRNDPVQEQNFYLTQFFLKLSKKLQVRKFIGLGSQAEYGVKNAKIKESDSLNPTTLYGKEKVKACEFAKNFCEESEMEFAWLRLFSSYGPKDNPSYLIPYVIHKFLSREAPSLTAGLQKWDYLYVKDLASKILAVSRSSHGGIFNLGSGNAVSIKFVVETIYDLIGPQIPLEFGRSERKEEIELLEADMSLFREHFGMQTETDLTIGLRNTIAYYAKTLELLKC